MYSIESKVETFNGQEGAEDDDDDSLFDEVNRIGTDMSTDVQQKFKALKAQLTGILY